MPKELEPNEAVQHAKRRLASIYSNEKFENVGLEEGRWRGGSWEITLGFDRYPSRTALVSQMSPADQIAMTHIVLVVTPSARCEADYRARLARFRSLSHLTIEVRRAA